VPLGVPPAAPAMLGTRQCLEHEIDAVVARELRELSRRDRLYRSDRPPSDVAAGPSFWWMMGWRPEPRCGLP
jgi:hypothetical protein